MCGTIGTARQASASGHARHAATADRAAPVDGTARQPGSAVPVPPLADPQGNDVTGRWPLRSYLELGALPSAVPCARLHTRHLLLVDTLSTRWDHFGHHGGGKVVWVLCDTADTLTGPSTRR